MAKQPSTKWLGLGATSGTKASATDDGERKKREADIAYARTLPSSQPSTEQLQQQWVTSQLLPVGASTAASAAVPNMPTPAETAILQDLGWQTPGVDKAAVKRDNTFDYQDKRIQESEAFDYQLNEQQLKSLEDLYKDTPGFKPPEESTVDSIRVMAEQNELAPVTWKQWDKMTPDERKATTYNTQLWKATQRDIRRAPARSQQDWSPDRQEKYDERVKNIFGENGGSEVRAINTLKLLEEINFTAVGQDLDEFLAGERFITAEELKDIRLGSAEPVQGEEKTTTTRSTLPFSIGPVNPVSKPPDRDSDVTTTEITNYQDIRSTENLAKLDAAAVRAVDDTIRERMSSAETMGWNVSSTLSSKKRKIDIADVPLGYSSPQRRGLNPESPEAQKEEWFNLMWVNLNDPEQKVSDVIKDIQANMQKGQFEPELQQEVWDWIDRRTALHTEFGQPNDLTLRDPLEIRKALGWEK